jgi:SAM-dependent methyltransferase
VPIPPELLAGVRCPVCGDPVQAAAEGLVCPAGHEMALREGYIDAGTEDSHLDDETKRTAASFGYEWTTFDSIEPEDEAFWSMYFRDVPLEALAGKVGLDAGCGKGRYSYFTARHLGALAAVDNSVAVQAAARNLEAQENVAVFKADLRRMPFADESFDFVSCLGVLHHLSDPEDGFRRLVRLLRPGGTCLIYVYSRPTAGGARAAGLAAAGRLRSITVRLPHRVLRALSAPIAALLYAGVVLPGRAGRRLGSSTLDALPLATYRGKPVRSLWLDTFDRLGAPIENRYIPEEIEGWVARAGLTVQAVREEAGLFVVATKPG